MRNLFICAPCADRTLDSGPARTRSPQPGPGARSRHVGISPTWAWPSQLARAGGRAEVSQTVDGEKPRPAVCPRRAACPLHDRAGSQAWTGAAGHGIHFVDPPPGPSCSAEVTGARIEIAFAATRARFRIASDSTAWAKSIGPGLGAPS